MTDKAVTKDFCIKLMAAVKAAKTDGIGFDDMDEGMAVMFALKNLITTFKADELGTGLMLVSDLTETIYDARPPVAS